MHAKMHCFVTKVAKENTEQEGEGRELELHWPKKKKMFVEVLFLFF